jgi:GNAT superfamily N-acetyltransferase
MAAVAIRTLAPDDAERCDAIVRGLPEWFGDPIGIADCAAAVRSQEGLVADDVVVVGFCTFIETEAEPGSAEITWMAVDAGRHRAGIGRVLVDELVGRLAALGVRRLRVKTLSERAGPYPPYEQTRAFYRSMGFRPVAELDPWGPENPAVLLERPL